eukprot:scpid36795/ scgid27846/ 
MNGHVRPFFCRDCCLTLHSLHSLFCFQLVVLVQMQYICFCSFGVYTVCGHCVRRCMQAHSSCVLPRAIPLLGDHPWSALGPQPVPASAPVTVMCVCAAVTQHIVC